MSRHRKDPEAVPTPEPARLFPSLPPAPDMLRKTIHFFTDPAIAGRPLIVTSSDIFVREDEAIRRGLRTPLGAYKPSLVRLRPGAQATHRGGDAGSK